MQIPKELTTVTRLSKTLALILFILLPVAGFFSGIEYQKSLSPIQLPQSSGSNNVPTLMPNNGNFTYGDTNNLFKIISPKSGEKLCLGKDYEIMWEVPAETNGITLQVAEVKNGDTIHDIGNFPGTYESSQSGKGVFSWTVGYNRDNIKLVPGPGYHIVIRGIYKHYEVVNTSDYFTISSCKK